MTPAGGLSSAKLLLAPELLMLSTLIRCIALAATTSFAAAQNPLIESYGSLERELVGNSVGLYQDIDGDGIAEYAVRHARGVRICRGTDGAVLREIPRARNMLGDVDGDGWRDFFLEHLLDGVVMVLEIEVLSGRDGSVIAFWPWFNLPNIALSPGTPVGIGDLNFDGRDDLMFQQMRVLSGGGVQREVAVASGLDASVLRTHLDGWVFAALGDLDGDGVSDYYVHTIPNSPVRPSVFSGASGATLAVHTGALSGVHQACGVSDVDGDGRGDIALMRAQPPTFAQFTDIVSSATGSLLRSFSGWPPLSLSGDAPYGDFDGDGASDLILWTANRTRLKAHTLATGATAATFDVVGNAAAVQDRDGDGIDEVLLGVSQARNGRGKWLLVEGSYSELVGVPFAFGDGSSGPCPCANGAPGEGCANSRGRGASLRAWGSTSIARRDLFVYADGTWDAWYWDIRNFLLAGAAAPAPVPFTGGLLALAPPIRRIAKGKYPGWDLASLNEWNMWSPGQVVDYQVWYRDGHPAAACGFGGNLSNALAITFTP